MTRVVPKLLPTRGGTMVTIFGIEFEHVSKPRCKFIGNSLNQKYPGQLTLTKATVVSPNVVICPSPSRIGNAPDDANAASNSPGSGEWSQNTLTQYMGVEQVDVNT